MSKIDDLLQSYENGKQDAFLFFGFISPPETEEEYRWIKECGYTHIGLYHMSDREKDVEDARIQKAVELAQKNGFKIVWMGQNFVRFDQPFADNDAFDGIYVDEPLSIGDLRKLSDELVVFQERYPNKSFHVNFPHIEGYSWDVYAGYFKDNFLARSNHRTVSGDIYPLREPNTEGVTMISFLNYIRRIGKFAVESDSAMYFFVQTISMHGSGWGYPARRPTTEDIRFLHYVILSCGAQGFQHFCYMSPGHPPYTGEFKEDDYSCIHQDGYRTEIWYAAQKVIAEFKKFENIALKFHWKGVMPVYGTEAETKCRNFDDLREYVASHSYIQSVSATQDLLVGCFEDDGQNVGFTLVNFSDPYKKQENAVSIRLNCTEPIAVIKDGEVNKVQLENGVYNTVLQPGEGQYIILPKESSAQMQIISKEMPKPEYLNEPVGCCWREDFANEVGNFIDTYNIYGTGNSHFEYIKSGYPDGGSGRVARLYTTAEKDKDWSTYKFYLPNIPYDENKKLVFKIYFNQGAFTASVRCDHMVDAYRGVIANTLERYGKWTWFSVPLKALWHEGLTVLKEVTMCIGNGIPYGTSAYLDEILLCDMEINELEEKV